VPCPTPPTHPCRKLWEAWETHSLSGRAAAGAGQHSSLGDAAAAAAAGSCGPPEDAWPLTEGLCAALAVMAEVGAYCACPCNQGAAPGCCSCARLNAFQTCVRSAGHIERWDESLHVLLCAAVNGCCGCLAGCALQVAAAWSSLGLTGPADWCHQQLRKHLCSVAAAGANQELQLQTRRALQRLQFDILTGNLSLAARQGHQVSATPLSACAPAQHTACCADNVCS
jgi:hypothetical protein